jgi:uncharacterized membrane protein YdjX (TVP38/TMEM64 family)
MKHYLTIFLLVCAAILVLFGVTVFVGVPVLEDPTPWLGRGGAGTAALTTGLLLVDVFVPVPSSLVMIANGVFFGVLWGSVLTLVGATGAALVGYGVGRWGSRAADRFIPPEERARARALVERWGALAVIVSRPVPILAEAVAVAAGLTGMRFGRFAAAAFAGSVPAAVLYSLTGAKAARLDSALLVFALVIAVAAVFWLVGLRLSARMRSAAS